MAFCVWVSGDLMIALQLSNAIQNIHQITKHPDAAALEPSLHGRTVLIVGPGPSLADHRSVIGMALTSGSATVIALSRAVPYLMEHGLTPDLAVAIDPQEIVHHDLSLLPTHVPVALGWSVHPAVWRGRERVFGFANSWPLHRWLSNELHREGYEITQTYPGLTVGSITPCLALQLGAHRVFMIGIDLANSADGQRYASGHAPGRSGDLDITAVELGVVASMFAHRVDTLATWGLTVPPGWSQATTAHVPRLWVEHSWTVEHRPREPFTGVLSDQATAELKNVATSANLTLTNNP